MPAPPAREPVRRSRRNASRPSSSTQNQAPLSPRAMLPSSALPFVFEPISEPAQALTCSHLDDAKGATNHAQQLLALFSKHARLPQSLSRETGKSNLLQPIGCNPCPRRSRGRGRSPNMYGVVRHGNGMPHREQELLGPIIGVAIRSSLCFVIPNKVRNLLFSRARHGCLYLRQLPHPGH